jgi:hypothetical protein
MRTFWRFFLMFSIFAVGLAALPAHASEVVCPHTPLPRLRPGILAVVADGVTRLNIRALPAVDTGLVATVSAGAQLNVVNGPSCNGHYNWWRVETTNGRQGWVAEGDWTLFFVVPLQTAGRTLDPYEWTCAPSHFSLWCLLP